MSIKLAVIQGYCDCCAEAKVAKCAIPKAIASSCKPFRRPQRFFMDPAGPYSAFIGGAKYLIQFLDDYTNLGRTAFRRGDGVVPPL